MKDEKGLRIEAGWLARMVKLSLNGKDLLGELDWVVQNITIEINPSKNDGLTKVIIEGEINACVIDNIPVENIIYKETIIRPSKVKP